ncbi:GNAT family N-acetyltransferase [Fodinibacter luteus]|uniref:GNAT family N-acetyltransferase n=1 Tax=Fodinibacter luteus TaxID=552064 RepID=A0ABP8K3R8_9MICO
MEAGTPDLPAARGRMQWNGVMTPDELLALFHSEVRLADRDAAPGFVVERDGPVHRSYPPDPAALGAMVECPEGLGDDPDRWVARQAEFFAGRGQRVEWKTYGYDEPADLPVRLERFGFVAEDPEMVLLGRCADLVHDVPLPGEVRLHEPRGDEDWHRVRELLTQVWGASGVHIGDSLRSEQQTRPDLMTTTVVEEVATGAAVSYAVLRLTEGTPFCGLWGGSTLPSWRRRGLYRALVSHRARTAIERGHPYARVDTSPDSRPILVRLGLHPVADTRPYVLDPTGQG